MYTIQALFLFLNKIINNKIYTKLFVNNVCAYTNYTLLFFIHIPFNKYLSIEA